MRSKPLERIIQEAQSLMAAGAYELNLIGQDTTNYGLDIGEDRGLVGLLESLHDVAAGHGGGWIRLMYAYPTNFSDDMIDAIASLSNIVKYIDMPLQHASDRMLDSMRRGVSAKAQSDLVSRLRDRIPGLALRTTFITGFPGEQEEDHQQLLDFIDEVQFDAMGVFRYSAEPGTVAARMDADPKLHVPDEVKHAREADLMLKQQSIAFSNAEYLGAQGAIFDVLIDGPDAAEESVLSGRCYHQAPDVDARSLVVGLEEAASGTLVRCRTIGSDGYDLILEPEDRTEVRLPLPISGS